MKGPWFRRASSVLMLLCTLLLACAKERSPATPSADPSPTLSQPAFVNGGDCPSVDHSGFPRRSGCLTRVSEAGGSLAVYALLDRKDRPRIWRMRFSHDRVEIDRVLRAGNAFSYPRVVGASDVNLDGQPEWWVKVMDFTSHGAAWSSLNVFFRDRGQLVPLKLDGQPLAINYGGISRLGEGARCRDDRLILIRAEAKDRRNTRWAVSRRIFAVEGRKAHLLGREEDLLVIEDYNDPDLDPFFRVDCNGFTFPGPP